MKVLTRDGMKAIAIRMEMSSLGIAFTFPNFVS
jgi:hypothetical protein